MISHKEARAALANTTGATKLVLSAYVDERESGTDADAPKAPTEAMFTEAQVMELCVAVRDAMLGVLPPPAARLSTPELFAWLHAHGGSSMTNTKRSERRARDDQQRFRAEAFLEGMRWRYGMRMDRAARAISAWREQHMGAVKPEPPVEMTPEQAILLAEILRENERPSFGHEVPVEGVGVFHGAPIEDAGTCPDPVCCVRCGMTIEVCLDIGCTTPEAADDEANAS